MKNEEYETYNPAIKTKYLPPKKGKSPRVSARDDEGRRVDIAINKAIQYDSSLIYDLHLRAVRHFCKVFGLEGIVRSGWYGGHTLIWVWQDMDMAHQIMDETYCGSEDIVLAEVISLEELMQ